MSEFIQYPLDLTGQEIANFTKESYNITKMSGSLYYQFASKVGPFFKEGAELYHVQTNQRLRYGIDYIFSYYSNALSVEAAKVQPNDVNSQVFYGIVIQNRRLEGSVRLEAFVVGGAFSTNLAFISASVNESDEYASSSYDSIVDVPATLPPGSHEVPTGTLTEGFGDMVAVLGTIKDSLDRIGSNEGLEIKDIIGLDIELAKRLSYGGGYQVKLASRSHITDPQYKAQIKLLLPKAAELKSLMGFTAKVVSDFGDYTLNIQGMVNREGRFEDTWEDVRCQVQDTNKNLKIRCTYDNSGVPVVYIGDATDSLGRVHVAITDFITSSSLADEMTTGWEVRFSGDEISNITPIAFDSPSNHPHQTNQLTGNPIIPKPLNIDDDLNELVQNDYRMYYPNFTDTSRMLEMNYPIENAEFSLKVEYTSDNYIRQKIAFTNGRAFNRIIKLNGEIIVDWLEMSIVKEDTYIAKNGDELTYLNDALKIDTDYEVTLTGSRSAGDVFKTILQYRGGEWVSNIIVPGSQSPTSPWLIFKMGRTHISCFDSRQTDTKIKVLLKVIG